MLRLQFPYKLMTIPSSSSILVVISGAAASTRNISVLGKSEVIIGGQRLKWARTEELPGVWNGGAFQLGDFKHLARFLATKARLGDGTA